MNEQQVIQMLSILQEINIYVKSFFAILGIYFSYKIANWVWKSLILANFRKFIKFKI